MLKRYLGPPESVHRHSFILPIGLMHLSDSIAHTFPGNCSPASNISVSVITVSYSKWTKFHTFGNINSTPFFHKSFKSCFSTSLGLKKMGTKTFTFLKSLSDAEDLYFICLKTFSFPFLLGSILALYIHRRLTGLLTIMEPWFTFRTSYGPFAMWYLLHF